MANLTLFWLRSHLKQGRIAAVYIVVLVLAVLNGLIYSVKYTQDLRLQREHLDEFEKAFAQAVQNPEALSDHTIWPMMPGATFILVKPPSLLKFVADNNLEEVPTARATSVHSSLLPSSMEANSRGSVTFAKIDLVFLLAAVFSFFAVVLTYDAVCGERQSGTLRQMLANGIPRARIITSKISAAMITLTLPLLLGLACNAVVLIALGEIPLPTEHLLILALVFFLAVLLLLFFVSLGVAVSSMTRSPVTSLIVLLLVWVLFIEVLPGSAKIAGEAAAPVRTADQFKRENRALLQEMLDMPGGVTRSPDLAGVDNFRYERETNRNYEIWYNRSQRLVDEHLSDLEKQAEMVRGFSRFSPTEVFSIAVSRLADNDLQAVRDFYTQVDRYREALFNILKEADSRDPNSSHLFYCSGRGYLSTKPFNTEVPRFTFEPPDLASRIGDILMDFLILFSLTVCAILIGIFAFNRYDVR